MKFIIFAALLSFQFNSFAQEFDALKKILDDKCIACHNSEYPARNVDLTTTEGIAAVVTPYDPDDSILYTSIISIEGNRMPYMQPALTRSEIRTIKKWISDGAHFD